jgi:rubrerythrin
MGIMLMFAGIISSVMFSSFSNDDDFLAPQTSDSFDSAANAMSAGLIIVGAIFIVLSVYVKAREEQKAEQERTAEEERARMFAQSIASNIRTGVKVRCRYCGALSDENDEKCESCGAPL